MKFNRFLLILIFIGQIIVCWACYETGYWKAKHETDLLVEETLELANRTIDFWMKFKGVASISQVWSTITEKQDNLPQGEP